MAPYRVRPNPMLAAPIVTLSTAIARHAYSDLLGRSDPSWHRLAHLVTAQLFPGSARHTLTLAPGDLKDLLIVLLDISLDYAGGELDEACGFSEANIHEAIDSHWHHFGPLLDC